MKKDKEKIKDNRKEATLEEMKEVFSKLVEDFSKIDGVAFSFGVLLNGKIFSAAHHGKKGDVYAAIMQQQASMFVEEFKSSILPPPEMIEGIRNAVKSMIEGSGHEMPEEIKSH